jgi:hypothetical protein
MDGAARRSWRDKATVLETLGEQTQAVSIPPENLNPITASAAKDKQLTRECILGEPSLYKTGLSRALE